jgi:hypothetical protein
MMHFLTLLGVVMVMIARESFYTVNIRQAYRRSPWGASRISSRTILFTNVPKDIGQTALFQMFPGVAHAWVASNCKELTKMVEDRDDTALKLEAAEIQLSRDANANRLKAAKGKKAYQGSEEDGSKWLDPKKRPTHKLKFLIGKKVDTIEYGRQHLAELIPKVQAEQDKHWNGQGELVGAVFLEFETQKLAQDAWQMMQKLTTKPNKKISARQLGVLPQEVVWNNLRIGVAEHWVRWVIATAIISVMIIFFAIPGMSGPYKEKTVSNQSQLPLSVSCPRSTTSLNSLLGLSGSILYPRSSWVSSPVFSLSSCLPSSWPWSRYSAEVGFLESISNEGS